MDLDALRADAHARLTGAQDERTLEEARVRIFGRQGALTAQLRNIKELPKADRPKLGAAVNALRSELEARYTERLRELQTARHNETLVREQVDVTLPGRRQALGALHPITQTIGRIESMFVGAGYEVVTGPEIEDDYHNFQALNIPADHPARAMHDTFYVGDGHVLRTHTSPVQVRVMERQSPPIRIICPGRVYRRDFDRTHTPMFHQVEGLVIDRGVSFADLKGTVIEFVRGFFERDVEIRFRPSYFPFTEPSAEVDVMGADGWSEVLGCGMVHPNVLEMSGIDSKEFSGFAFGFGVDRLAMLDFDIRDLRTLFENDVRFLEQAH